MSLTMSSKPKTMSSSMLKQHFHVFNNDVKAKDDGPNTFDKYYQRPLHPRPFAAIAAFTKRNGPIMLADEVPFA